MRFAFRFNLLILSITTLSASSVSFTLRQGRPVIDGVFVNGAGPYRFLLDTGAQSSQLDRKLAEAAGLRPAYQVELASAAGVQRVGGMEAVRVRLGANEATGEVLFTELAAVRSWAPDVQGVLGQSFLGRFDYRLDFREARVEFGARAQRGIRAELEPRAEVPVVFTSLGRMAIDTGTERLILFGKKQGGAGVLRTAAGTVGVAADGTKSLVIEGAELGTPFIYRVQRPEGMFVDGLLPATLFASVYFCNSKGYVEFE